jgi:hypothetical protein
MEPLMSATRFACTAWLAFNTDSGTPMVRDVARNVYSYAARTKEYVSGSDQPG